MGISTQKVSGNQERLMQAIGLAVQQHTTVSPMRIEDIVACLAFATGGAIAQTDRRITKSELRSMALSNIDNGISAVLGQGAGSIILPH